MTAAEIAGLALEHAPATKRGVNALARREAWGDDGSLSRRKAGRGGALEYHVSLLPAAAVAEIVKLERIIAREERGRVSAALAAQEAAEAAPAMERLTARQRLVMDARAALLTEIDRLAAADALTRSQAINGLMAHLTQAADGDPLLAAACQACERNHAPSRSQLYDWLRLRDRCGLVGLAPRVKRQKDPMPDWFEAFLAHYARPQKPCIAEALDNYRRALPDPGTAPTYAQVRRALARLGPLEKAAGREGKLALRKRLAYVTRDTSDLLPSSVYVADGKTFDAEVAHPVHGRAFRPEITSLIDASTRLCVGWSADIAERTFATVEALRHACRDWGVPALFYTDRGPGYVSGAMADPVVGFLARASITPMKALPYNAQAKGVVERFNQTYGPLARRYPTYLGPEMDREARHRVYQTTRGELKEIGTSRTLPSWADFLADMAAEIAHYNDRPHSALPKIASAGRRRHLTPREAWEAKCGDGFAPIVPAQAELDEMFRPYVIRVARRGLVEFNSNSYFLPELQAADGQRVAVGYDNLDASKVWLRQLERTASGEAPGAAIGIARFAGNAQRYVPLTMEQKAIETRARGRKARLDVKYDEIEAEARVDALLDLEAADRLPAPANDRPAPPPMLPADPGARPHFPDDVSFAAWIAAHADRATPGDAAALRAMLQSGAYRDQFRSHGLDIETLMRVARTAA